MRNKTKAYTTFAKHMKIFITRKQNEIKRKRMYLWYYNVSKLYIKSLNVHERLFNGVKLKELVLNNLEQKYQNIESLKHPFTPKINPYQVNYDMLYSKKNNSRDNISLHKSKTLEKFTPVHRHCQTIQLNNNNNNNVLSITKKHVHTQTQTQLPVHNKPISFSLGIKNSNSNNYSSKNLLSPRNIELLVDNVLHKKIVDNSSIYDDTINTRNTSLNVDKERNPNNSSMNLFNKQTSKRNYNTTPTQSFLTLLSTRNKPIHRNTNTPSCLLNIDNSNIPNSMHYHIPKSTKAHLHLSKTNNINETPKSINTLSNTNTPIMTKQYIHKQNSIPYKNNTSSLDNKNGALTQRNSTISNYSNINPTSSMKHIFDYDKANHSVNSSNKLTGTVNSTKHNCQDNTSIITYFTNNNTHTKSKRDSRSIVFDKDKQHQDLLYPYKNANSINSNNSHSNISSSNNWKQTNRSSKTIKTSRSCNSSKNRLIMTPKKFNCHKCNTKKGSGRDSFKTIPHPQSTKHQHHKELSISTNVVNEQLVYKDNVISSNNNNVNDKIHVVTTLQTLNDSKLLDVANRYITTDESLDKYLYLNKKENKVSLC